LADVHKTSVVDEFEKMCTRLPVILREPCDEFVSVFGPVIVPLLEKKETADAICLAIGLCGGGKFVCDFSIIFCLKFCL
jgi:hypothetical protein